MRNKSINLECLQNYSYNKNKWNIFKFLFGDGSRKEIKFIKMKSGRQPTILTINGFNTEGKSNHWSWKDSIDNLYPENEWYQIEWPSEKISILMKEENKEYGVMVLNHEENETLNSPRFFPLLFENFKSKIYYFNNIIKFIPILLIKENLWGVALKNCKLTSVLLLNALHQYKKDTILIGHSLGARMIFYLLRGVAEQKVNFKIIECHLLGGAIYNNKKIWLKVNRIPEKYIYNYYSKNDDVLKYLYTIGTLDNNPIGRKPINIPQIKNIDSSIYVSCHSEFINKFKLIYEKSK